jgi:pimeloyl-ACP methyl ester carboxylesterase
MESTIMASGTRIAYEQTGSDLGEPLLLINGLGAQLVGWRPTFREQLASQGFRVVAIDNRDVGGSSRFPDMEYSISDLACDCVEFLDSLNVRRAHIVGQSMGGMVAQEIAIQHPEYVESLALLYSSPDQTTYRIGEEFRRVRNSLPSPVTVEQAIANYLINERACASKSPYFQDTAWLEQLAKIMFDRGHDAEGIARQRSAMERSRPRNNILKNITARTLVLHGRADQLIDYRASVEMASEIPNADLVVIGALGHEIHQAFEALVVELIERNARRATAD